MPMQPILQWMQLPPINGMNMWAALDGAFQFLVVEETPDTAYSASVKKTASVKPNSHRLSIDPETRGLNVIALEAHRRNADEAAIIGGEGVTYASLDEAKQAAEVHARQMRRGLA